MTRFGHRLLPISWNFSVTKCYRIRLCWLFEITLQSGHIDGLMQERRNSTANALKLCLSCTNRSINASQLSTTGVAILCNIQPKTATSCDSGDSVSTLKWLHLRKRYWEQYYTQLILYIGAPTRVHGPLSVYLLVWNNLQFPLWFGPYRCKSSAVTIE